MCVGRNDIPTYSQHAVFRSELGRADLCWIRSDRAVSRARASLDATAVPEFGDSSAQDDARRALNWPTLRYPRDVMAGGISQGGWRWQGACREELLW